MLKLLKQLQKYMVNAFNFAFDQIYKHDFFISYRREDASEYARDLKIQLELVNPKLDIFLDIDNFSAGDKLIKEGKRALNRSKVLIVLGSPLAWLDKQELEKSKIDYVLEEVESFPHKKKTALIVFKDDHNPELDTNFKSSKLYSLINRNGDTLFLTERMSQLTEGLSNHQDDLNVFSNIIEELVRSYRLIGQKRKRSYLLIIAITLLSFTTIILFIQLRVAEKSKKVAEESNKNLFIERNRAIKLTKDLKLKLINEKIDLASKYRSDDHDVIRSAFTYLEAGKLAYELKNYKKLKQILIAYNQLQVPKSIFKHGNKIEGAYGDIKDIFITWNNKDIELFDKGQYKIDLVSDEKIVLAYVFNNDKIVSIGINGFTQLWTLVKGEWIKNTFVNCIAVQSHKKNFVSVTHGVKIVYTGRSNIIDRVQDSDWFNRSDSIAQLTNTNLEEKNYLNTLNIKENRYTLSCNGKGDAILWNQDKYETILTHRSRIKGAKQFHDLLVTWTEAGVIKTWKSNGKLQHQFKQPSTVKSVYKNEQDLIICSTDGSVTIWGLEMNEKRGLSSDYFKYEAAKTEVSREIFFDQFNEADVTRKKQNLNLKNSVKLDKGELVWRPNDNFVSLIKDKNTSTIYDHKSRIKGADYENGLLITWGEDNVVKLWKEEGGSYLAKYTYDTLIIKGKLNNDFITITTVDGKVNVRSLIINESLEDKERALIRQTGLILEHGRLLRISRKELKNIK